MKILNIMLSRELGGIQQAFIDYNKLIKESGYEPIPVISARAKIEPSLKGAFHVLPNFFSLDPISIVKLRNIIKKHKPSLIIAHGNRAINFSRIALYKLGKRPSLIGVAHNYSIKYLKKCDYVFGITRQMCKYLELSSLSRERIMHLPNTLDQNLSYNISRKKLITKPFVIGCLARFVPKKGVDVLIKAAFLLKQKGYNILLLIGGDGELRSDITQLIEKLELSENIVLCGWVENKEEFFEKLDIYCLPSIEEPFGIIILEAMKSCVPIIATKTDGPEEILEPGIDAILVDINSPEQIAEAAAIYINDPVMAGIYATRAAQKVKENYSIKAGSSILKAHIQSILKDK
ncbi:MAG: glycosyltransferase [Rickettsiaceae bacterium]|nr:glycosyltransferase [Rickettsiaceae bacterium]